jgi:cell division protein FtsW
MKNFSKISPLYLPESAKSLHYKILLTTLILSCFGCVMVYSASWYSSLHTYDNEFFFLTKQIVGVLLGCVLMLLFYNISYKHILKFNKIILIIAFVLLILVFVPYFGVESYGAKRWLNLGFFTIQASELAKFAFVFFCASYLTSYKFNSGKFKSFLPIIIVGGLMSFLILLEPNMSITMCTTFVLIIMLFIGGLKFKYLLLMCLPLLFVVPLLIVLEPYRMLRLLAFLDPWANPLGEGYQLIQSLYALGNGGLFGVGLFSSIQAKQFLPFAESDFIFSIIGEELGFFGATIILFLFFYLILNIFKVAKRTQDRAGKLLCVGIASILAVQVLINVSVVSGLIPPTGVPLPFISAGSTSLVVFMSAIGVVLNVNKQSKI